MSVPSHTWRSICPEGRIWPSSGSIALIRGWWDAPEPGEFQRAGHRYTLHSSAPLLPWCELEIIRNTIYRTNKVFNKLKLLILLLIQYQHKNLHTDYIINKTAALTAWKKKQYLLFLNYIFYISLLNVIKLRFLYFFTTTFRVQTDSGGTKKSDNYSYRSNGYLPLITTKNVHEKWYSANFGKIWTNSTYLN